MTQRRTGKRISMQLPVEITWKTSAGSEKQAIGKTDNLSGSGLFIEVPVRVQPKTPVSIKVVLPRLGAQAPIELLCEGRVVRWNQRGNVHGLGAVIDSYELRPAL